MLPRPDAPKGKGLDETVSLSREAVLKRIQAINDRDKTMAMVVFILNSIYRQFLGSSLFRISKFSPLA
jgi:hypothetical protein